MLSSFLELKEHGNELFKDGKYHEAIVVYSDALGQLDRKKQQDKGVESADQESLRKTLYSNRAQCYLKQKRWQDCISDCSTVLEKDAANIKVLFRRAQAYLELKQLEPAVRDCKLILSVDKDNKATMELMQRLRVAASNMNSTTSQTLEVIDACVSTASDKERTSKLRAVLGSLMEDHLLAKSICAKGACDKLWTLRLKSALALKIISKLSEYEGCFPFVLAAVSTEELVSLSSDVDGRQDDGDPDTPAAALNAFWRLCLHEDECKKEKEYEPKLDAAAAVQSLTLALRSDHESLRRVAVEGLVRLVAGNKDRARAFLSAGGMDAVLSVISRDLNRNEPVQQASVVLGQVLPALQSDDDIKAQALAFCKPLLTSEDVFEQIKGAAALDALYYANKELGEALVTEEGLLDRLRHVAHFGSERTQALTCEIFSHLSNSEKGRGLLAGETTDLLKRLAVSSSAQVRSSAAVTLAKLNALDFNAESEDGMLVLASVANLLEPSASKEEHAKGVEAVAFVVTDSQVKMMFIKGDGLGVLEQMCKLATDNPKDAYAYGLSFCFENLSMSEDDKRREKLREMEVTEEQWEQFEKLTKSQTRKPGQVDPRENVEIRIKVFVQVGGIAALRALVLQGTSERVWEAASRTLCNIATVQEVRQQMIAQGGLRALFKLTHEGTDKCKKFAAHALAKIFVTTNPNLIKDEQLMDTIGPLVRQVRHSDEDLLIFECCMALTNIATVSFEAKQKMVNAKALQAFEYATYSENLMVRRAAVESINNLIPTEKVVEWFSTKEKLRLWLLFAQCGAEDAPTAHAAMGALANVSADERVAKALADQDEDALKTIVSLAQGSDLDMVHRAVVCLLMLVDTWPQDKGGKQALVEAGALQAIKQVLQAYPDSSVAEAAKECQKLLEAS